MIPATNSLARFVGKTTIAVAIVLFATGESSAGTEKPKGALSYSAELDITGPAAVPIFFELGDDRALVRYVPCCNIYGGTLTAARGPERPMESKEGLPVRLLSSFVTLDPDPLTASTAGLYFQFKFHSEDADEVAAYEWRDGQWKEMLSYEIDAAAGTVSFHCPDGGIFVLGIKGD